MGAICTTKTCIDCGLVMENCDISRKRCPECAKAWARFRNNEWKRKARQRANKDIVIPKITKKQSSQYCEGCHYYGGEFECNKCCNYIFVHGKKRPCPPGKDCTVKVKKSRINARDLTINGQTKCVVEWAEITGISKNTLYFWYTRFGREYTENKTLEVWNRRKEDGK